jgi:hypothetical protein
MSYTVDVESRGPVDTASDSAHEIILDPLLVDVLCYFTLESLSVES